MKICDVTKEPLQEKDGMLSGPEGLYWSNLEKDKAETYSDDLKTLGAYETMKRYFPQHEGAIFSSKRAGGIATLDFSKDDIVLDAGCMWGALSIPLARTGAQVFAIDQTKHSLLFLSQRKKEENLDNLHLICSDLKKIDLNKKVFDKIIVNGVLEWVSEEQHVEVNNFIKKQNRMLENVKLLFKRQLRKDSPRKEQRKFLEKLNASLKDDGTLYLAIENRYDFMYFVGLPEPHCGIRFFSFLPHWLQNIISILMRGRRFRNWTYSRRGLKKLLNSAGFSKVDFYYGFPDYRSPEMVLSKKGMKFFKNCSSIGDKAHWKKIVVRLVEEIVYKRLKLTFFAPSFIVHAKK